MHVNQGLMLFIGNKSFPIKVHSVHFCVINYLVKDTGRLCTSFFLYVQLRAALKAHNVGVSWQHLLQMLECHKKKMSCSCILLKPPTKCSR